MSIEYNNKLLKIRRSKETDRPFRIKEYIRLEDENVSQYIIGDAVKSSGHYEANCYLSEDTFNEGLKLLYADSHFDAVQIATIAVKKYDSNLERLVKIIPESSFRSEIERRVREELSKPE